MLGTPGYWSPEQASGGELGPATDVYSLSATFYALLTGEPPCTGSIFRTCEALRFTYSLSVLVFVITARPSTAIKREGEVPAEGRGWGDVNGLVNNN